MNGTNMLWCPLASGWVQSTGKQREEIEDWLFISLASSLRSCFKVVCVPQPEVLGSPGGFLFIAFF